MSGWACAWAPAALWASLIFALSGAEFSADQTRSMLRPIVLLLFPSISEEGLEIVHFVVRKLAHFLEYFVFALLLDRGFRLRSPVGSARAPLAALAVAALYSLSDEAHQSFVAARTPSLHDCAIDTAGAALAALGLAAFRRHGA